MPRLRPGRYGDGVAAGPLSLFVSYAHEDALIVEQLRAHLTPLEHEGVIDTWHDRDLRPGDAVDDEISARLDQADLVIAIVSADFVASEYAYGRELQRALQLHELGRLTLIPVIARDCLWHNLPIGALHVLPDGARPIASWDVVDAALVSVARGVEAAARARLETGTSLVDEWLTSRLLRRRVITAVQEHLRDAGLYDGPIDGIPGQMTELAVRAFQRSHGLTIDGRIGPDVIGRIQ